MIMKIFAKYSRYFLQELKASFWGGLFILIFLLSGISTLKYYGLTWDESLGNLFFGARYLHFFATFQGRYLSFNTDMSDLRPNHLNLDISPLRNEPWQFPALADTFSALTMYVFSYGLKWLNPIDGFHLFTVLLAGYFLWSFYRFLRPRLGHWTALFALLLLGTFPRFWADMHFNVKDIPETIFYGLAIMSFIKWHERPSWQNALLTGLWAGCALGVKANAIFLPIILILGVIPWRLNLRSLAEAFSHYKKYFWHYGLMVTSAAVLSFLSWPYLYSDPYHHLMNYWTYIFERGTSAGLAVYLDPIRQFLTTMPELMLVTFLIGLFWILFSLRKEENLLWKITLVWCLFPILRVSVPGGGVNFDGIRHFEEFLPAAAMISAVGIRQSVDWLAQKARLNRAAGYGVVSLLFVLNFGFIYARYFPYVHLFYNQLTGGLAGAKAAFLGNEATDYWASSYRQGVEWLDQNAPENSSVSAVLAPWILQLSEPVLFRPDLQFAWVGKIVDLAKLDQSKDPAYVMFITRFGQQNQFLIDETQKRGRLVHQIVVDQVPILEIYQLGGH